MADEEGGLGAGGGGAGGKGGWGGQNVFTPKLRVMTLGRFQAENAAKAKRFSARRRKSKLAKSARKRNR